MVHVHSLPRVPSSAPSRVSVGSSRATRVSTRDRLVLNEAREQALQEQVAELRARGNPTQLESIVEASGTGQIGRAHV